jgi:uncharacterized membrane protein
MAQQRTFLHESFETRSNKTFVADIRSIGIADLKDALRRGYDDFKAMPSHAVFLCVIYPVIGVLLGGLTLGYSLSWMLFPIIAGFALVGPLAAVGLYELSRRREAGLDTTSTHALDVLRSDRASAILALGIMQLVIYGAWLAAAQAIYYGTFGDMSALSLGAFLRQVFTTQQGWMLILVGNAVGFFFALLVLFISAFSFPMVVDRHVGAGLAAETSVRAVWHNLRTMIVWGIIVAALLAIGFALVLVGLAVVMPILGHATWHLYRKAIAR